MKMKLHKHKLLLVFLTALFATNSVCANDVEVGGIWYSLNIGDKTASVTYFHSDTKYYTGDVSIPSSFSYDGDTYLVTAIRYDAFDGCTKLTSISIPNSVTSIGNYAFSHCTSLTSITIPGSVTSLGRNVFPDCRSLTSIYMVSSQPPSTGNDIFGVPSSCVIYVPTGSREAYSALAPWNGFTIEEYDTETGINCIGTAAQTVPTAIGYYDLQGRRLSAPAKGLHVVRYSDGTTRKVFVK